MNKHEQEQNTVSNTTDALMYKPKSLVKTVRKCIIQHQKSLVQMNYENKGSIYMYIS